MPSELMNDYWPILVGLILIVSALLALFLVRRGQRVSLDEAIDDRPAAPRATLARGSEPPRLVATTPTPMMPLGASTRRPPRLPPITHEERMAEATAAGIDPVLVALPRPTGPGDNLLMIKGLGPRIALLLNGLGIERFDQVAALSPEQVAAIDRHLGAFAGRFDRDRWVEQARFLAKDDIAGFEAAFGAITPTTGI